MGSISFSSYLSRSLMSCALFMHVIWEKVNEKMEMKIHFQMNSVCMYTAIRELFLKQNTFETK